jgi:maleate cis-trans isomerase
MGTSMQTVEKTYTELEEHTKTIVLTINTMQTKVTIQSRKDLNHQRIEIQNFTCLRTQLTKGNEEEVEIQKRIMSANNVYFPLLPITKSQLSQRKDKL